MRPETRKLLERDQKDVESPNILSRLPIDESGVYSCATCKKGFSKYNCQECPSNQTSTFD